MGVFVCAGLMVIENTLSAFSDAHTDLDQPRKPHLNSIGASIANAAMHTLARQRSRLPTQLEGSRMQVGHIAAYLDDAYAGADGYGESASMDAMLMMKPCRGRSHCTFSQSLTK